MAVVNQFVSFHAGGIPVTGPRETVTFAGNGTWAYGSILARDTTTLKLVPYVKGGVAAGNGVPECIVLDPAGVTKTGGAGDVTNVIVYRQGRVLKEKLIIIADGNSSNIDATVTALLQRAGIEVTASTIEHAGTNNY